MTPAEVLKTLMDRAGIASAGQLAKAMGNRVSQPTISRILAGKGTLTPKTAARLAAHFAVPPAVVRGEIPMDGEVTPGHSFRRVPLFRPDEMTTDKPPPERSFVACPVECGAYAFALEVDSPAMMSDSRPNIPPGAIVIVDPDRSAESGAIVCVRLAPGETPVLRQYVVEGGRAYLVARNPSWPERIMPFPGSASILGRVVFFGESI